jgi:hypothetical protein
MARIDGQAAPQNGTGHAFEGLDSDIIYCQFDPANAPETFRVYKRGVVIP